MRDPETTIAHPVVWFDSATPADADAALADARLVMLDGARWGPAAAESRIATLRATPTGPGLPVVIRLTSASSPDGWLDAGADAVVADGTTDDWLARFGRVADHPSARGDWPDRVRVAFEQFNAGDYHDAHDGLEEEWRAEPEPVRYLWQGILQVGIAAWQVQRGNAHGTRRMLVTGLRHLRRFWPGARHVDVRALVAIADAWRSTLRAGGLDALRTAIADGTLPPMRVERTDDALRD